jgi:hypothetical protein
LNKFEFLIVFKCTNRKPEALELIAQSFKTPFWIEHEKWFVICEYSVNCSWKLHVYSITICKSFVYYEAKLDKISTSTSPMVMNDDLQEKVCYSSKSLFDEILKYNLYFV